MWADWGQNQTWDGRFENRTSGSKRVSSRAGRRTHDNAVRSNIVDPFTIVTDLQPDDAGDSTLRNDRVIDHRTLKDDFIFAAERNFEKGALIDAGRFAIEKFT